MTEYRKQLYERVKHNRTIGNDDRSALVMIMNDCERYETEIKSLNNRIEYLENALNEYHKFDSFLYAHGLLKSNNVLDFAIPCSNTVSLESTGEAQNLYYKG